MNILVIDNGASFLDFCLRSQDFGHEVRLWRPTPRGKEEDLVGKGLVEKVTNWQKWMGWADLIVVPDNASYRSDLAPYFKSGYPIFGCNQEAAELELDRAKGQDLLAGLGIDIPTYETFSSYDKAISYVKKHNKPFVSKPWGGTADKMLSYVAKSPADLIFKLQHWKEEGKLKGQFMLQEFIKGTEMAVGGWFGPGGWNAALCENFEEKAFMNEGLGGNTGEQGTVLRYTKQSKLFEEFLEPITDHLHELNYVGYCDVNTIIDEEGKAWPLEFTMRFGDPTFNIQKSLHKGDDATWMLNLLQGKDTLVVSDELAVGILLTHGDYPHSKMTGKNISGFPIYGITEDNLEHIHFNQVMDGVAPAMVGGQVEDVGIEVTAGDYVLVVTGTGPTVMAAQEAAYEVAWELSWPSNKMMRTDIGDRLEDVLPTIQQHGYADKVEF